MKVNGNEVWVERGVSRGDYMLVDIFIPHTRERHRYVRSIWVLPTQYNGLKNTSIYYSGYSPITPELPPPTQLPKVRACHRTPHPDYDKGGRFGFGKPL